MLILLPFYLAAIAIRCTFRLTSSKTFSVVVLVLAHKRNRFMVQFVGQQRMTMHENSRTTQTARSASVKIDGRVHRTMQRPRSNKLQLQDHGFLLANHDMIYNCPLYKLRINLLYRPARPSLIKNKMTAAIFEETLTNRNK